MKIRYIGISLATVLILSLSLYSVDRYSYSKEIPFYPKHIDNDSILTIGIIGDSWVAGARLDTILYKELLQQGIKTKIISSGHSGAKSKLIYQNLFKGYDDAHSSRFVIENNPDYCIVIAGVNDAISQMGSHFYAYHLKQIIITLLHYKIRPVIVTLPEFGIEDTFDNLDVIGKTRNGIAAYINNKGEINNIQTYRKVFTEELESDNLEGSIILVDFDKACIDYHKCPDLYSNSSHLSPKGDTILCHIIANVLIGKIKSQ